MGDHLFATMPKKELRTKRIIFRLSPAEFTEFTDKVAKAKTTTSVLLRDRILSDNLIIVAREAKKTLDKKKLIFLYAKASNNLNQLAHQINISAKKGGLSKKEQDALLSKLISIDLTLKEGIFHVD